MDRRLEDLDDAGVELQALSPMPELFSYWAPVESAAEFCRAMNQWLAAVCRSHPRRYAGFGIVPLQDPEAAVDLVAEVAAMGLLGIEIGTNVHGVTIADSRFMPVWRRAAALGLRVFIHAFHPSRIDQLPAAVGNAVTFPVEIGEAIGALIATGTLSTVPDLVVLASHGGGSLPHVLPRLVHAWMAQPAVRAVCADHPWEVARRLYYDLLVFDSPALRYIVDRMGRSQVVVGSDYPFVDDEIGVLLRHPALAPDAALVSLIRSENARRFLGGERSTW